MIRFQGVSKRYGRTVALHSFTFDLARGGFGVWRGPNGAGKSTAMKIAAGVALPDRGECTREPGRIGFVGHVAQLLPTLSVGDNLLYQTALFDVPRSRIEAEAARFGVDRFWSRPAMGLSRGMAQRAALARAFSVDAVLLLLDEPDTGLDEAGRQVLWQAMAERHSAGVTTIVASHAELGFEPVDAVNVRFGTPG